MNIKEGIIPVVLALTLLTQIAKAEKPKRMKCNLFGCTSDKMVLQDLGNSWEISFIKTAGSAPMGENFSEFSERLGFALEDEPEHVVLTIEKKYCQESRWGMRGLNCNGPVKSGSLRVRANPKYFNNKTSYELKTVNSSDKNPWELFLKTLSYDPIEGLEWSMALTHNNSTTNLEPMRLKFCEQNP